MPHTEIRDLASPALQPPGTFLGLFVPVSSRQVDRCGFATRWRWTSGMGIAPSTAGVLSDPELVDAYWTVLECHKKLTGITSSLCLEMAIEDLAFLDINRYSLVGGSLGLAMLLGIFCYYAGLGWPLGLFAWGNIRPMRNNRFGLYPVDGIDEKLALARSLGLRHLVHPREEGVLFDSGRETLVSRNMSPSEMCAALKHGAV